MPRANGLTEDTPPSQVAVSWGEYKRLRVFVQPYAGRLTGILGINLVATLLGLTQPLISKLLIDVALPHRNWKILCEVVGLMFVATVVGFVLNILSSYQYVRVSAAMLYDMRVALYRHLQTLSPRFYAKWRLGDLVSRLNNDIGEVQRVSADTLLSILSNVVFLIGSIAAMLWLDWKLFLLSVVLLPLCLYTFTHYQRKLTVFTKELRERAADVGSLFVETLIGMRSVVAANAGEYESQRFGKRNKAFVDALLRLQMVSFLSGGLPGTILTVSTSLVFLYGGRMIIDGKMTIGTLVAFMGYHTRLLSPVQNMMGLSANLAAARVSLRRIFEILDTPAEVVERPGAMPLAPVRGRIVLEDVMLRHDREDVLKGVSCEIRAGTFCAILGPSGAGKSTIADLLVRFLDPDAGRITVDGVDLSDVAARRPSKRNGAGRPDAAHVQLFDCGKHLLFPPGVDAGRDRSGGPRSWSRRDDSTAFPMVTTRKTGERGLALSAGERQRIALARALLRNPSVLILDEPTSALDPETERIVAQNLRQSLHGRTVIIITHRPALAEIADSVLQLRDGRIVDGKPVAELAPA